MRPPRPDVGEPTRPARRLVGRYCGENRRVIPLRQEEEHAMTEKTRREVVVAAVEEALEPIDELLGHLHDLPKLIPKRTPVMRRTVTVSQARRAITKMKGDMQLPKLPPGED